MESWMEVRLDKNGLNKMPNNLFSESRFFLMLPYEFCTKRIAKLQKIVEKELKVLKERYEAEVAKAKEEYEDQSDEEEKKELRTVEMEPFKFPEVSKVYEPEPRITESLALRNFQRNRLEYDAVKGSEFLNLDFDRPFYCELLEYHAIFEFNNLKGKTFVPLNQFLDALRVGHEADGSQSAVAQMCNKLKKSQAGLTSVILVSGIPGSGKGRFAATLARTLKQEKVRATSFKMPTVQSSIKYSTDAFVSALIKSTAS